MTYSTSALTLSEGLVNGVASLTQQSIKVYELDRKGEWRMFMPNFLEIGT